MTLKLSIETDTVALRKFLEGYGRRSRSATAKAMNEVSRETRSAIKTDMKSTQMQGSWRPRGVDIKRATATRRVTVLTSRGRPVDLLAKDRHFVAPLPSTRGGSIWKRVGRRRYPIRLLFVKVEADKLTRAWAAAVERTMRARWPIAIKRQLKKAAEAAKRSAL